MGKTEESPAPVDELHSLRKSKRRKKAEVKFCRGAECSPEAIPPTMGVQDRTSEGLASSPPLPVNPSQAAGLAEPRASLYVSPVDSVSSIQAAPASVSSVSVTASTSAVVATLPSSSVRRRPPPPASFDLRFLLDCDAISRDFLFPLFSFGDLLNLERTCKAIRGVIWSKQIWQQKVTEFRLKDEGGDRLLSRFSSSRSERNPEYYKKMISKYLTDTSKVYENVKGADWRFSCMFFDIETTCHRAFAIHESGQFVFIQDNNDIQVLCIETNKSKRGIALNLLKSFPIVQLDDYCSLVACHSDLVFHATYRQLHAWDWRRGGKRVKIVSPKEIDVTGLGLIRALCVQDDCIVVGSNDGAEPTPTTGQAMVQIWQRSHSDSDSSSASSSSSSSSSCIKLSLLEQVSEVPVSNPVWDLLYDPFSEFKVRTSTSIALAADEDLVAIGFSFHLVHKAEMFQHLTLGRLRIYDKKSGWILVRWFDAGASRVRINASQRKAVVGFDKDCYKSKPYVRILDIDTGDTLKRIISTEEDMTCLWTDWKRFIFTGSVRHLLLWEVVFGVDDVGPKRWVDVTEDFVTGFGGQKGVPMYDKFYDVYFDGFHMIVYSRGQYRAAVRIFDCLKLRSIKF